MRSWVSTATAFLILATFGVYLQALSFRQPTGGTVPAPNRPDSPRGSSERNLPVSDDSLVTARFVVPRGASLVLGSLDRNGALHRFQIEIRDAATPAIFPDVREVDFQVLSANYHLPAGLPSSARPLVSGSSIQSPEASGSSQLSTGFTRRFRVPYFTVFGVQERFVLGTLLVEGDQLRIYLDDTIADQKAAQLQVARRVAEISDAFLLGFVADRLSAIRDVDDDGKLTLLISDLCEDARQDPVSPITGCVRGRDFTANRGPFGGDIVYLDSQISREEGLAALLAHEYAHAAAFSLTSDTVPPVENAAISPWVNEAIAHCIELEVDDRSSNLLSRLKAFALDSGQYPVVVTANRDGSPSSRGGSRIAGCSFLATSLTNAPDISLREIALNGADGLSGIESLLGRRFPELFRTWTVSLLNAPVQIRREHLRSGEYFLYGTAALIADIGDSDRLVEIQVPRKTSLQVTVVNTSGSAGGAEDFRSSEEMTQSPSNRNVLR